MTTTDRFTLEGCDDPGTVLAYARDQRRAEQDAGREVMLAAARWASMHSGDSLVGPAESWHETALPLGGEGCPEVAEFAVVELAAALGRSTESGRRYLAQVLEGHYRLPGCWARLAAGVLPAWKLGIIAEHTRCLSPRAAAYVDAHVAHVAHTIGPAQLGRLVEEAKARFDPEATEADRRAAADRRRVDLGLAEVTVAGTVRLDGEVDLADALDLDAVLATDAEHQRRLGSPEPLDVRRAIALGNLARGQATLDLTDPGQDQQPPPRRTARPRRVMLHVHLSQDAVLGAGGLARVEETRGPVTAAQVRTWCGHPDTQVTVLPVLDLAEHIHHDAYEATDRLKAQADLRDLTCIFPHCTRPARACDHDHRVNHRPDPDRDPDRDHGGPTCSCNIAPLCRPHHRAKTTGRWTYQTIEPGTYLWHSPHGYHYLRDHHGTLDITPDHQRRRLAREFRHHLDEP